LQEYQDEDYQSVYFIADSFEKAKEQLRVYSKNIKRPYTIRYDPHTQSIKIVDDLKIIQEIKREIQMNIDLVVDALSDLSK
jgi:hypothetical protein